MNSCINYPFLMLIKVLATTHLQLFISVVQTLFVLQPGFSKFCFSPLTCVYVCLYACVCVCARMRVHKYMHMRSCVCVCVCVYVHVCC